MEKKTKKILLEYLITFLIGGAAALAILLSRGTFDESDKAELYKDLCDAFTVPGVLLILFAALAFVSNGGAFDGLKFALKCMVNVFRSDARRSRETYAEYRERKHEKQLSGYSFLFFVGLFFFVVALVFLALYYAV